MQVHSTEQRGPEGSIRPFLPSGNSSPVEWKITPGLTDYHHALAVMEARAAAIRAGEADELVWLVEHPPIYTAGTSADPTDLTQPSRLPVIEAGRGGRHTYHGPGQRVAYVMLDLSRRRQDVRAFVTSLEEWAIRTLAQFGIVGERRAGRVGVWVTRPDKTPSPGGDFTEDKIAAIGIRVRRWVSSHGISLNVDPVLSDYEGIVACGLKDHGVTSFTDLGRPATMAAVDAVLADTFTGLFGAIRISPDIRCDG